MYFGMESLNQNYQISEASEDHSKLAQLNRDNVKQILFIFYYIKQQIKLP